MKEGLEFSRMATAEAREAVRRKVLSEVSHDPLMTQTAIHHSSMPQTAIYDPSIPQTTIHHPSMPQSTIRHPSGPQTAIHDPLMPLTAIHPIPGNPATSASTAATSLATHPSTFTPSLKHVSDPDSTTTTTSVVKDRNLNEAAVSNGSDDSSMDGVGVVEERLTLPVDDEVCLDGL